MRDATAKWELKVEAWTSIASPIPARFSHEFPGSRFSLGISKVLDLHQHHLLLPIYLHFQVLLIPDGNLHVRVLI